MKKLQCALTLGAILGSALLMGCQNSVNTVENSNAKFAANQVDLSKFSSDNFCRDRLNIINVRESTTNGGVKQIQVQIRSERYGFFSEIWSHIRDANPYYVDYRIEWFDQNGMKFSTPSPWLETIFIPGETKFLQSVAPNSNYTDFLVSLKESNK